MHRGPAVFVPGIDIGAGLGQCLHSPEGTQLTNQAFFLSRLNFGYRLGQSLRRLGDAQRCNRTTPSPGDFVGLGDISPDFGQCLARLVEVQRNGRMHGVQPNNARASTSAPASARACIVSVLLFNAAACIGVQPN